MSMWKMTLRAMEDYLNMDNDSLFKDITLPTGMDKDLLVDTILDESEEFACIYQDGLYMKKRTTDWFTKYASTISKWWELWNTQYSPLHNFDRNEEYSDIKLNKSEGSGNENRRSSNIKNDNTTITSNTENEQSGENLNGNNSALKKDNTNETKVSAYDSSDYQPSQKVIDDGKDTNDTYGDAITNDKNKANGSGSASELHSDITKDKIDNSQTSKGSEFSKHKGHLYGNIGVTKTQEMYRDENLLRLEMNPYSQISDLFLTEFTIMLL